MSASKFPMRYALLVAALMQILPSPAMAAEKAAAKAKAEKEDDGDKACDDCPSYAGWSNWVEVGLGIQTDDSYHFGRYTGNQEDGAYLNANAESSYRAKKGGGYFDAAVTNLGLESRNVRVEAGDQGKYGVALEYDQIPNYLKQYPGTNIKTERDRTGLKFTAVPSRDWEIGGYYRHEKKDGTREVGATFGFSQTQILAVPVSYETNDFGLSAGYKGERFQAEIAYAGSLFDNGHDAITWSNPAPPPLTGRIAEAPDNQSHQISALMGYQLSDATRIGARLAFGRMTQDQAFLPYSTGPSGPLPAPNLDGEVTTTLAKLDISSRLSPRLRLEGSYAYNNRDNNTPVRLFDHYITDTVLEAPPHYNRPYSYEQNLLRVKAAYRLPNSAELSGGFDYDKMDRTYVLVEQTKDRTLWAKLKLHAGETVDTSLKLSHANRDASTPRTSSPEAAYQNPTYPESGITYPGMTYPYNPLMLAFQLADRTRDKVGIDLTGNPNDRVSLGFALDYYKDDYTHMELGLHQATGLSLTPSATYAFSDDVSASAFYTYEKLTSDQKGREWITNIHIGNWAMSDSNTTQTVGLTLNWKVIPEKFDLGADLVYADFTGKLHYGDEPNLPDVESTLTALGVHGVYRIKDNLSFRADYRYERYKDSDWSNVALPFVTTLGVTPREQETHLVYFSIRYAFK